MVYAKRSGHVALGNFWNCFAGHSNKLHVYLSEFRVARTGTASLSALRVPVAHVVLVRAEKQVRRIHTTLVVAGVQHMQIPSAAVL